MDNNAVPTKGNLIRAKNSLKLAKQGYELMDKKRNILIRELMGLVDQAKDIQDEIRTTFTTAYAALQKADMELGINAVADVARNVPVEDTVEVKTRSIMGTRDSAGPLRRSYPCCRPMPSTARRNLWISPGSLLKR